MPMRPMMEDHNFRELLRMERDVTRKLFRVDQAMRAVAGEDFRRLADRERLQEFAELLMEKATLEKEHLDVVRSIWRLKINWK